MTTPQPRRQFTARAGFCPWLLVWLVPWLFLSVAANGLHDHDLHGFALHQEQTCTTQSAATADNSAQAQLHAASHTAAHHDCQACRWSAQSALAVSISGGSLQPLVALTSYHQAFSAPLSLALPALRGRGPPSV